MDIRGHEKTIYFFGPEGAVPSVTVSLDGSEPVSVSASQTVEYASGQYKTVLTAAQMDAADVSIRVLFGGYLPTQILITTETDGYATASALEDVEDIVSAAKAHTDTLANADLSQMATKADATNIRGDITDMKGILSTIRIKLSTAQITVKSPIAESGVITLVKGMDYLTTDGMEIQFADAASGWPDLTGGSVKWVVEDTAYNCTVVDSKTVHLELSSGQTTALPYYVDERRQPYELWATLANGHKILLVQGEFTLIGG